MIFFEVELKIMLNHKIQKFNLEVEFYNFLRIFFKKKKNFF